MLLIWEMANMDRKVLEWKAEKNRTSCDGMEREVKEFRGTELKKKKREVH